MLRNECPCDNPLAKRKDEDVASKSGEVTLFFDEDKLRNNEDLSDCTTDRPFGGLCNTFELQYITH